MNHAPLRSSLGRPSACALAALLVTGVALAQPPAAPAPHRTVTEAERRAVVRAVADSLRAGYVYEDRGAALASALVAAEAAGTFRPATTADSLAAVLTRFLQARSNDRHLRLRATPPGAGEGPVRRVRVAGSPGGSSPSTSGPARVAPAFASRPVRRAEMLAGGVGYVALGVFGSSDEDRAQVDSAMNALRGASALVFDVGRSPGGSGDMVAYISSYLFDRPTHLASAVGRGMPVPQERWTLASVPGPRMASVPVVVLTSSRTASAAESFAFGLVATGRARLVGERTAGAGHFGGTIALPAGFSMFLPVGRTYDPRTGRGWEAEGLAPAVEVPYDRALDAALALLRGGPAAAPPAPAPSTNEASGDEAAVRAAERAWLAAFEQRDAAAVERVLADEYVITYSDGRTSDRAGTLAMLARAGGRVPRQRTENTAVRLYGDVAVLTGVYVVTRSDGELRDRYTDVWVRRDGRWQVAASQLTRIGAPGS